MPQATDDELQRLAAEGIPQREIARRTGIPRTTVQNRLKRMQVYPVHRGTPRVLPRGGPQVDLGPLPPAELNAIRDDLLEVAAWWRARKLRRVDPRGPRETQRWTVHIDRRWVEAVKDMADAEGISQADVVDRIFSQFFEGR